MAGRPEDQLGPEVPPPAEQTPPDLFDRARDGDREAIAALLERHLPGLRAYVRLKAGPLVRAREATSDLVQSVCRELLVNLDQFEYRGEGPFRHWLYTAALRKIVAKDAFWRAEKRDAARDLPQPSDPGSDPVLVAGYRSLSSPSQVALAREEIERIEKAFERLTDEQREVILLARVAGLSRREIGESMGKSEEAVRVALHRALARLAALIDQPSPGQG
jgi:RNA polymerase sigma factor (sigma-70 family)